MMIHTDDLASILEARDRELVDRLTKWFQTVGRMNGPMPTSDSGCRQLAEIILVYPDTHESK